MTPHLFNRRYFSAWTQSNNTADSATAIEIPIHKQCRLLKAVGVGHLRLKQKQPEKMGKIKTKYHWQQLYWSQSFGHKTEPGQQRVNRIKSKLSNRQQLSNSSNSEQRLKKEQSTNFFTMNWHQFSIHPIGCMMNICFTFFCWAANSVGPTLGFINSVRSGIWICYSSIYRSALHIFTHCATSYCLDKIDHKY